MTKALELITNIKSPDGEPYSVSLGKNTLIWGENEANKSAIVEALQLARTGAAYGLAFKTSPVKKGPPLNALIPFGQTHAFSEVSLDDGEKCRWILENGKNPKREGPNGATIDVASIRAKLGGNSETQARFFYEQLCFPESLEELIPLLPPSLEGPLNLLVSGDSVSLSDLLGKVGSRIRETRTSAQNAQLSLASLGSIQSISDAEITGLWSTLDRCRQRDSLREMAEIYRRNPSPSSSNLLQEAVSEMGGKSAILKIPETEALQVEIGEALLHKRLARVAAFMRGGETRASEKGDSLKHLHRILLEEICDRVGRAAPAFAKKVSTFLPKGEEFLFEVDGTTISVGLLRNGQTHKALSGSTEARVIAAIAAALSTPISLILLDDRMFSTSTLSKTLSVLEKAEGQVVAMGLKRPPGKPRKKWTYVQVVRTDGEPLEVNQG